MYEIRTKLSAKPSNIDLPRNPKLRLLSVLTLCAVALGACQQQQQRTFRVKDAPQGTSEASAPVEPQASSSSVTPSGSPEAEAGFAFSAASEKAAASAESPSVFGSMFAFVGGGSAATQANVPVPPSSGDSLPTSNAMTGVQKVKLSGMSLRDAVGLAIAKHPEVGQAAAIVSQSAAEVAVAKAAWFPVLQYNVSPGYGSSYSGSSNNSARGMRTTIGASQLVYDFGKTSGAIELADAGLNRQRYALNDTIENVAYTTANYFIEFSAAQATIEAARSQISALQKTRQMISDRVRAGLSDASDLTQADVAMQRAIVDQVSAQTKLDVAAGNLAQIIGVRPQTVISLTSLNKVVTSLSSGSADVENAPAVMASKEALREAEARVKIARSDYLPAIRVSANRSLSSGGNSAYDSTWVGVTVDGAVSTAAQTAHRVDSARAEKDAAGRQIESRRLSARTALSSAETETAGANTRGEAYDKMKELSRTSRDLYWQEYTLNKRPLNQVLDAERDIFSAESQRIVALSDGIMARIKAHSAMGTFVRKLREL